MKKLLIAALALGMVTSVKAGTMDDINKLLAEGAKLHNKAAEVGFVWYWKHYKKGPKEIFDHYVWDVKNAVKAGDMDKALEAAKKAKIIAEREWEQYQQSLTFVPLWAKQ